MDFNIRNEGSVIVFTPLTKAADAFLERCDITDWQWMGPSLVVDHRPAVALVEAMQAEGLEVA
jgi:hypothetical protein